MAPALYLDENVHPEIAARLRAEGYDVLTAKELGLLGAADEVHLAYAAGSERILFTHDMKDFRVIATRWAAEQRLHSGIVYSRRRPPAAVSASIRRLFELYTPDQLRNVTIGLPIE